MSLARYGIALSVLGALFLGGCGRVAYYSHLLGGQLELLQARQPIDELLADPSTDPKLRRTLSQVLDARIFAHQVLGLPDNRSYTLYADLGRDYVVWNVFATPELSLSARQWCHPLVGCMAYRGYYQRERAEAFAESLAAKGSDVHIGGVPAYSTLGWFSDPVLNTMLRGGDEALIGTVFHELAHQRLYVKNDTAFNESFASFVEEQGLADYLAQTGTRPSAEAGLKASRQREFVTLVLEAREDLRSIYASDSTDADKLSAKAATFERLRARHAALRDGPWQGYTGYDRWFATELNNARLLPFGLYDERVPAFAQLFADSGRNWPAFYLAVEKLAELERKPRDRELDLLASRKTQGLPGIQ